MKKILLGIFAIMSISTMAANNGVNVYGRLGLDVYSHYNKYSQDVVDGDGDFFCTASIRDKGKMAPSIAIEVTKDLNSNFEVGLGIGYVSRGKRDYKEDFPDSGYYYEGKMPAINSIPLYLTGKYKFDTNSNVKPYIKADLGYSFNRMKNSFDVMVPGDGDTYPYNRVKAKNGLYTAIGLGVEYNNITADLSYVFTAAKVKTSGVVDEDENRTLKANNSAIRLTVGYKFSF
ncbi:PorT family protein [Fusobacterium nucleatum]|uniref:outer membrane protein n=1 Tax=Fusobacterium nucleatum TaxID=851 RepID=UPI003D032755